MGLAVVAVLGACSASLSPADRTLVDAATAGDAAAVRAALAEGARADARADGGWTPLMLAARRGDMATVEALLAAGADVDATNEMGETALMVCHATIVSALLAAGADPNATNVYGETVLFNSSAEKLRVLVKAGADVERGSTSVDIDAVSNSGLTPLMRAAQGNDAAVVRVLLESGADVSRRNAAGQTALMRAAWQGTAENVRLLLAAGAQTSPRDDDGRTAMHFAAMNLRRGVIEELVSAGADANVVTADGRTPLLMAVRDGYTENVRALLAAGSDPRARDRADQSALDWAEAKQNREIAELLRQAGAGNPSATRDLAAMKKAARLAAGETTLRVSTGDVVTDGGFARIRGAVHNDLEQPVEGVRYLVTLHAGDGSRILDVVRQEVGTRIPAGDRAPMRLEFRSMYLATEPRFTVEAFPVRVGAQAVPPPPRWSPAAAE